MNNKVTAELLEKFINNQCTPDEIGLLNNWFNSFSGDDDFISGIDESTQNLIKEKILGEILNNIQNHELQISKTKNAGKSKVLKLNNVWFKVAASLIFALTVSFLLFRNNNRPDKIAISGDISFVNKTHSLYKLVLSDNSTVWISPNSSFIYPSRFQKTYRLVKMSGECFFEITKGPNRPFVIQSRHIITKVWGTSFRVRDDASNKTPDVSVLTGRVSVAANNSHFNVSEINKVQKDEVILLPHQKGIYRTRTQAVLKQADINNSSLAMWNKLSLSFQKTSLNKIIPVLESKFNVKITVEEPVINTEVLNADLNNFNLPDILTVLEKSFGIKYAIEKDHITLSK
jgi:ferric-dicitrate binding protein FerR (iron transport regulator)